ncbi:MAG: Nif11-like leader peptide family natural product precursor [Synechococcaceae cyanobacterium]|nr:Nif11-like leader peptide family natural product precursor [Synechococcaceae cyanobacterium]
MTLSALQAFVSSAADDPQLRDTLRNTTGLDDVVALAQGQGHGFSKATLLKAHAEAVLKAPEASLEGINSWGDALLHCFGASAHD